MNSGGTQERRNNQGHLTHLKKQIISFQDLSFVNQDDPRSRQTEAALQTSNDACCGKNSENPNWRVTGDSTARVSLTKRESNSSLASMRKSYSNDREHTPESIKKRIYHRQESIKSQSAVQKQRLMEEILKPKKGHHGTDQQPSRQLHYEKTQHLFTQLDEPSDGRNSSSRQFHKTAIKSCDSRKLSQMLNLNMQSIVEDESDKELSDSARAALFPPNFHNLTFEKNRSKVEEKEEPLVDSSYQSIKDEAGQHYKRFESRKERMTRLKGERKIRKKSGLDSQSSCYTNRSQSIKSIKSRSHSRKAPGGGVEQKMGHHLANTGGMASCNMNTILSNFNRNPQSEFFKEGDGVHSERPMMTSVLSNNPSRPTPQQAAIHKVINEQREKRNMTAGQFNSVAHPQFDMSQHPSELTQKLRLISGHDFERGNFQSIPADQLSSYSQIHTYRRNQQDQKFADRVIDAHMSQPMASQMQSSYPISQCNSRMHRGSCLDSQVLSGGPTSIEVQSQMPIEVKPKQKKVPSKPVSAHPKALKKAEAIDKKSEYFNHQISKLTDEKPKELFSSNIKKGQPKSTANLLKDKCARAVIANRVVEDKLKAFKQSSGGSSSTNWSKESNLVTAMGNVMMSADAKALKSLVKKKSICEKENEELTSDTGLFSSSGMITKMLSPKPTPEAIQMGRYRILQRQSVVVFGQNNNQARDQKPLINPSVFNTKAQKARHSGSVTHAPPQETRAEVRKRAAAQSKVAVRAQALEESGCSIAKHSRRSSLTLEQQLLYFRKKKEELKGF